MQVYHDCGTETIKLSSHDKVWCPKCQVFAPWPLKENQPPLVTSNRDKRKG